MPINDTIDYYPFGMQMPGRVMALGSYRYGFNGKEMDDEISGSGNQYDYGFRIYNPRLGKFLSVDPLFASFPYFTPYQFASNMPIAASDLDGGESKVVTTVNYNLIGKDGVQLKQWNSNNVVKKLTENGQLGNGSLHQNIQYTSFSDGGLTEVSITYEYFQKDEETGEYNVNPLVIGTLYIILKPTENSETSFFGEIWNTIKSWFDASNEKADKNNWGYEFYFKTPPSSLIGQGQEDRTGHSYGSIEMDLLYATLDIGMKALKSEAAKNLAEGVGKLVDAYQTGKDLREQYDKSGLFKCKACAEVGRDSIYKEVDGQILPAQGNPTEERSTHY